MTIKRNINYPLFRELKEIGIISDDGTDARVDGPFKMVSEIISGQGPTGTTTLSQSPLSNGVIGMVGFDLVGNDATNLVADLDYSISGSTVTFLRDHDNKRCLVTYAY